MPSAISRGAQACIHIFRSLIGFLQSGNHIPGLDLKASQVQDEFDKFLLWARNNGAIQGSSSHASLDSRLQDAPFVSEQIVDFLQDLSGDLYDSKILGIFLLMIVIPNSLRYCLRPTRESSSVSRGWSWRATNLAKWELCRFRSNGWLWKSVRNPRTIQVLCWNRLLSPPLVHIYPESDY